VDATLERLFELVAQVAGERDRRALLILDEFQEIIELDPQLPKLLRSVLQEQPEVAHFYLGSKRHMMERIFNDANEPFWRSAKQLELGPIAVTPFAAFIAQRFEDTGRRVEPAVVDRVLEITGGHPYATQELLYFLWQATPTKGTADSSTLDDAVEATLRSEHSHFTLIWDGVSAAQKRVLQALAQEQPGRPLGSDYQRRHSLPATPTVQTALNALERAELVGRLGRGAYRIAEPFLTEWIRRYES
jgi:hypothetical protein